MFLRIEKEMRFYVRQSKSGKSHPYKRLRSYAVFKCDECHIEFKREKGKVDPKRLDDLYVHVCPDCDPKRFAQKKGVEQRRKLNIPVDADITIDEL
jgi:hypothetical protein|tara:strand:+ start:8987 stop:9274 length:288 start_codon:yes stop_codon:yes gene_type:complete